MKLDPAKVPSIAKTAPNVIQQEGGYGAPYRASSVVLAYNSQYVSSPPKTLDDIYTWVKANKGKFAYNPPDTGGSGGNFVTATLKKFIPQDQLTTFQTGYDAKMESAWDQGFALLKSLGPYILNNGFYPKGNVPVLQELGKQTIYVAPVWSDQGLSYLSQKLLPDTVKLEAIDPPFSGGAAYLGVPTGSQHQAAAFKFIDWVLQPEQQNVIITKLNGYPGLEWQYMPADVQQKFAALAKNYDTFSFSSKFSSDVNKLWYEKVAGTPPPPAK
jgi:putative spermidine/putrescine transport system substrate-binding protein